MSSMYYLNRAVAMLNDAASEPNSPDVYSDIHLAIQAVERVRTKVILRERNLEKEKG